MVDLAKDNYSLYAIPVAYVLLFAPHVYIEAFFTSKFGKWNNVSPRLNIDTAASKLTAAEVARLKRAAGAHINGLESLPIFGLAVLAANYANVPTATLNKWSLFYILMRVLYNPLYIGISGARLSFIRSLVWFGSQGSSLWLAKLAADRVLGGL